MLQPRWKKIIRDVWNNKTRTILVVLTIAVGVFAFGTIASSRINTLTRLHDSFLATNPVSAILTTEPFDDKLVEVVRRIEGVGAADGRRKIKARINIGTDTWEDLELYAVPDNGVMQVNMVRPYEGAWPPPEHTILIERSFLPKTNAAIGDMVAIEVPNGEDRIMQIAGTTHDLTVMPAAIADKIFGYISFDTLEWLGKKRVYDEMLVVVAEDPLNEAHIRRVANRVADKMEHSGREVLVVDVPTPQQHPAEIIVPTLLLILSGMGVVALLLGSFLIINTVEAIVAQQTKAIGIMKSIGARNSHIMQLYAGMVLIFGMLALVLAIPLGMLGAYGLTRFLINQLNVDVGNIQLPIVVLSLKIVAALLLPLITAYPTLRTASRMTIRDALDDASSLHGTIGKIDQMINRIRHAPLPMLLALRNTFRRKGRLIRTLFVLTMAGAFFISVLTLRNSLYRTLDDTLASKGYDIEVRLTRSYRMQELQHIFGSIAGITRMEGWGYTQAYPLYDDGSEGERIQLYAPPENTTMLHLAMKEGQWLRPDDTDAIVLSNNFLVKDIPKRIGDAIVMNINGKEYTWYIIGFSDEFISPVNPALGYVNYNAFANTVTHAGHINNIQITTTEHSKAFRADVARVIEEHAAHANIHVTTVKSLSADRDKLSERFNIITVLLSVMAFLIGMVGGLGLMGMMSINVIERRKEIGILRAIGASDRAVQQIVMAESIVVGVLAWFTGTLLAIPLSVLMCHNLGLQLLSQPLTYTFTWYALIVWLVVILVVATVASLLPARSALRITIREVLAYE